MSGLSPEFERTPELAAVEAVAGAAWADAGFVNARAIIRPYETPWGWAFELRVRGACPCGLGESSWQQFWEPGMQPPLGWMYDEAKRVALDHIEHDRAEGRWA